MQSFVCVSVCLDVTPLLQHLRKLVSMSNGKEGNRPERKLEAQEARAALDISYFIK
jgi:hypothetical protein